MRRKQQQPKQDEQSQAVQKAAALHSDIMAVIKVSLDANIDQRLNTEVATGIYHVLHARITTAVTAHMVPKKPDET